jgi:TolB-like protein/Tfp pilus assembly protein PilF
MKGSCAATAVGPSDGGTVGRGVWCLTLELSVCPTVRLSALQCPDGSAPPCRAAPARTTAAPPPNSVAVLYFDNLSPDTTDAYLADGLTEELIAQLGKIERVVVKSRTAMQRYRRTAPHDPADVARRLGVAHLVSGSVRRSGARLRVTVELVRAATGTRMWGDQYDRSDADLLAVQEGIAIAVATAIAGRLLPEERARLARRPTGDATAYDRLLRGDFFLAQRTAAATRRAMAEYEAAVAFDSTFARAWARIAYAASLSLEWDWDWPGAPRDSVLARAFAAEARARRLDPESSDAWLARAVLLQRDFSQRAAARLAYERAVTLDPRNDEAWHQFGSLLEDLGADSAARSALQRAIALEPSRATTLVALAWVESLARRDSAALRWADSALIVDPGYVHGHEHRAQIRAHMGRYAEARADAEFAARSGSRPAARAMLAIVAAAAGDTAAALQYVMDLDPLGAADQHRWITMALIVTGQRARALEVLEQTSSRRGVADLRSREFDPLRGEPRFQRLVESVERR